MVPRVLPRSAAGERIDHAVVAQSHHGLGDAGRGVPGRRRRGGDRHRGTFAEQRHHRATHLTHRALERSLAPSGGPALPGPGRTRCREPAPRLQRTGVAARSRAAHVASQVHQRLVPRTGVRRVEPGLRVLPGRDRGHLVGIRTVDDAGPDPADVRVDGRHRLTEREARDRRGRVLTHAGQGAEIVDPARHPATVLVQDHTGSAVERHGAPRIPESPPRAEDVGAGRRRQIGDRREAQHERLERRHHACGLRLLQHHLAHQHGVRVGTGAAPGIG